MGRRRQVRPVWFRTYQRPWLRHDAVAGLTVLSYMLPQVLAYAGLAGLPPIASLTTAAVALVVYAVLGSSRVLSVGPESTTALMAGLVLAPLVRAHPAQAVVLTSTLTLLVGLWLALGAIARAGVIAQLLTRPILTGYMAGEALLMVASQLGPATGTRSEGTSVPAQLADFLVHASQTHRLSVAVSLLTFLLLLVIPRVSSRWPAALTAVALMALGSTIVGGSTYGLQVLGPIPRGLPPLTTPSLDPATIQALAIGALGIALLAFSDMMLVARGFARPGDDVDANRELLAASAVHVANAFVGGYPSSASSSRSALGRSAGQRTQLSGVITALGIVMIMAFAGPLLEQLPIASLAALVFWAAFRLVSIGDFGRLWHFRRSEFAIALATAAGTAIMGILPGIGVAVALSAVQILVTLARPHEAVEGFVVGKAGFHDVDDYEDHVTIPGLLIFRYDGPLIAYNRDDFRQELLAAVSSYEPRWVLLNVEANMLVDYSGCETLRDVIRGLQEEGRVVGLARLKLDLRTQLERAGVMDLIGSRSYETLPQAIRAFQAANPDIVLPPLPESGEPFDPRGSEG